ncbi:MAG: hypothetical protein WCH99_04160 [Verrucomicrobiota bacterium]
MHTTKPSTKPTEKPKRNIVTFEPCGPVSSMIENELRGKKRGAQTILLEKAVVNLLRSKYPKLAARYDVLQQELSRN